MEQNLNLIVEQLTNANVPALLIAIISLVFSLICAIVKCIQNPHLLDYFKNIKMRKIKTGKEALPLYYSLYQYVRCLNNLRAYSPKQASDFERTISKIIKKYPYYCSELLDSLLLTLHRNLAYENPDYIHTLIQIRLYIMNEYYTLQKSLGYPSNTKASFFRFTSHWDDYFILWGEVCICLALFLTILLLPCHSLYSIHQHEIWIYIYCVLFLLSMVLMIMEIFFCLIGLTLILLRFIRNKRNKTKLFNQKK